MKLKTLILSCLCSAVLLTSCGESIGSSGISGLDSHSPETEIISSSAVTDTPAASADASSAAATTAATTAVTTTAATTTTTTATTTTTTAPEPAEPETTDPYCMAAMIKCADDGKVLYSYNASDSISLASITKLMTACTALKYLSPETEVTVGSEIAMVKPLSTLAYLWQGMTLSLSDLMSAMLLPSGNDAAYTAAVSTARAMSPGGNLTDYEAVNFFVGLMNGLAEDLGMENSHFANPEGWDDPGNYTTAEDLMKLVEHAWSLPTIRETVGQYQKTVTYPQGGSSVWTNTNRLMEPGGIFYDEDVIGIKTGTTDYAGCCLVSAYLRNGKTYFCIVMGCYYDNDRYLLTQKLMDEIV